MSTTRWPIAGSEYGMAFTLRGRSAAGEAEVPRVVVEALLDERRSAALVAELAAALGASLAEDAATLRARVREALRDGRLVAYGRGRAERAAGRSAERATEAAAPMETTRAPVKTWITIRLVDDDDQPVAGTRYRLKMPDGDTREGTLDANGIAHVEGIDPGECEVTLLDLDADTWDRTG